MNGDAEISKSPLFISMLYMMIYIWPLRMGDWIDYELSEDPVIFVLFCEFPTYGASCWSRISHKNKYLHRILTRFLMSLCKDGKETFSNAPPIEYIPHVAYKDGKETLSNAPPIVEKELYLQTTLLSSN